MGRKPRGVARPDGSPAPRAWESVAWIVAVVAAVSPLWVARDLPFVDLPQHLFLISVVHSLNDPTTLWHRFFEIRPGFTPYLGYYYSVSALACVVPLELANRIFLSICVAGVPLSLGFLLRSLGRPAWPALLAIPTAYGDSLAWGFINYCAALPPTILSLAFFIRALTDVRHRTRWAALHALVLLAVLAFHPVPMAFLALALPWLLVTTRVREDASTVVPWQRLRARLPALVSLLPCLLAGCLWVIALLLKPPLATPGAPATALEPLLSSGALRFETFGTNLTSIPWLLANMMQDGSDAWGLWAVAAVGALAVLVRASQRHRPQAGRTPLPDTLRPYGLCAIAFVLYFALPVDVQGRIYALNTRFIPLAAGLTVTLIPRLAPLRRRTFLWLAVGASLLTAFPLARGFRAFDDESRALRALVPATGDRPIVMGLMFDNHSRVVHHPVFIHSATVLARARGGVPDFTFAYEPHELVRYRVAPPPPLLSGWRPELFDYTAQGRAYDHFLVRGRMPERVFGSRLGEELHVAAHSGDFWLIRRRP